MWPVFIVVFDPLIEIVLQLFDGSIELLAERKAIELIEPDRLPTPGLDQELDSPCASSKRRFGKTRQIIASVTSGHVK
jgi:hypothetical protein